MEVEIFKTEDVYPQMIDWFKGHNFPIIDRESLPEHTFVCFSDDNDPIYSVCFYKTDSRLAWIGWELSDPHLSKSKKEGGLTYLLKEVCKYAKELGYQTIITTSGSYSVKKSLEESEFKLADKNINQYMIQLWE